MSPAELQRFHHPDLDEAREARLLVVFNILLAYVLALMHTTKSVHFLDWKSFIALEGSLPFQSRVLPFLIAHGLDYVQALNPHKVERLFLKFDFVGALMAAHYVLKALRAIGGTRTTALFALILFWWQVFASFVASPVHNYYYPYDLISVGIISMATWAILAKKPIKVLAAICLIGMLNRETAILIPFLYLAANWPCHRGIFVNFLKLLVICLLIKFAIHMALKAPGDPASLYAEPGQLRLVYNFTFLSFRAKAVHTFNVFFAFGGVWLLLFLRGKTPDHLNRMAWCFLPFAAGMSVVANLSEIRVFSEFIPLLSLMLACKLTSHADAPGPSLPVKQA